MTSNICNDCKWLYVDWCHRPPNKDEEEYNHIQEKCHSYLHNNECPNYEK